MTHLNNLPPCMMPDGGHCCDAHRDSLDELRRAHDELDFLNVPRFSDGLSASVATRLLMLVQKIDGGLSFTSHGRKAGAE